MPLHLRKTVKAGPFRFTVSGAGVNASVGVKGLRIGSGPRGHYITAGRGAIRYRASLPAPRASKAQGTAPPTIQPQWQPPSRPCADDVEMVELKSLTVCQMEACQKSTIIDDLNATAAKSRMSVVLGVVASIAVIAVSALTSIAFLFPALLFIALPAYAIGKWLDSYKRAVVLHYSFDGGGQPIYESFVSTFDSLAQCNGIWRIEAGGHVSDLTTWKRNAGASKLIRRQKTSLSYGLPSIVASNLTPPSINIGSQTLFFLPDMLLVQEGATFGGIDYEAMKLVREDSRFIEDDGAPLDATVVDRTWLHPNKRGGPDLRFKQNHQIPICLYDMLHLSSTSGFNVLLQLSKQGASRSFIVAARSLSSKQAPTVRFSEG